MSVPRRVPRRAVLRSTIGSLALLGLPAGAGCGSSAGPIGPSSGPPPSRGSLPASLPIVGTRHTVALDTVADLATVVGGLRSFGLDLHRASAAVTANWTVSPLSMDVAFGMLRAGSRGSTARQIDAVFGFTGSSAGPGSSHPALNALTAHLVTTDPVAPDPTPVPSGQRGPKPIVAVANGLFVQASLIGRIGVPFRTILATQYGASPAAVDFADPSATAVIDAWVKRQTLGRIAKLFDRLDPGTLLVLANAVYFKATWLEPFWDSMTITGPFTTAGRRRVSARLMRQTFESVPFATGDGWQRVTLPYVGGELSMRIVVPTRVVSDVAALAPALAAATAPALNDRPTWLDLTLPRWNTATTVPLLPALRALGLTDVADLSGIAPGLAVSDAIHRANITVDEQGTEAAAVTGIAVAASARIGTPTVMRIDRPFCWAVVHEPTGAPVFAGHVVDPTG